MKKTILILLILVLIFSGCSKREAGTQGPVSLENTPEPALSPSAGTAAAATPDITAEPALTDGQTPGSGETPQVSPTQVSDPPASPTPVSTVESQYLEIIGLYEAQKAVNPDTIGWLRLPNTKIDYPVMLCDNNEYYLTHDADKLASDNGVPFMDFRNADSDRHQLIIWGKNMKNGTMFHDLMEYKTERFFNENRIFEFLYKGELTKWEIFMAGVWDKNKINPIQSHFTDGDFFAEFENEMIEFMKDTDTGFVDESVRIVPDDRVLVLCTASYEFDGAYMSVWARRIN